MTDALRNKIEYQRRFWERTNPDFLLAFSPGDYFVSRRYTAAAPLLRMDGPIGPRMVVPDDFRDDYLRLRALHEEHNPHAPYCAAPFSGIPWMEAMLGCEVLGTGMSFIARMPRGEPGGELPGLSMNRQWRDTYLAFIRYLHSLGRGRFGIGQPILRGPLDIAGALAGQTEMVYALHDNPEQAARLLEQAVDRFLEVIACQQGLIDPLWGGYMMGWYNLWCPGECVWFQDDLTSLLSPSLYERFVLPLHRRLAAAAQYTMVHIHPSSLYCLDYLLEIPDLNAIQINKDIGGPSVRALLPAFQKVQATKNLVLWGDFTAGEIRFLRQHLDPAGVYIIVYGESALNVKNHVH